MSTPKDRVGARAGLVLLGVGLGAFIDGIVLHQLLQWHHMASGTVTTSSVAGLRANTWADGAFHAVSWVLVLLAAILLLGAWRRREAPPLPHQIAGLLLVGWGAFTLTEGVVVHLVLGLHHVRDDLGGPLVWDLGLLVLAAALLVVGLVLAVRPGGPRLAQRDAGHADGPERGVSG